MVSGNKVVKELHGDNYLKILNKFLGQYGHGINHLDSFKIWEVDVGKKLVGNGPRLLESLIECILEGCPGPILLQCMEYKNRPEFLISKVSQYYNYVVWHG
ncbi:hypothetical protein CMV_030722 [Castanea mollissima]|uniref:Uncharacterized protein n=1 Tax=Castanea mollissima TaxID=60419 RepID=A0A8J4V2V4_9ROSI|nr:hypothetical protein CMV_030722 [Castanea mollissima]